MTTPNDLQSKLEAITQAAVGALGYLPVNVPGARMAKERIEAVLAGMGAQVPDERPRIFGAAMTKLDHTVDVTYGLEVNLAECIVARLARQRWSGSVAGKFIGYHRDQHEAAKAIEVMLRERDASKAEPASEPRAIQVGDTVRLRAIGSVGKVDHVSDAKPGTLMGSFPFHVRWDLRTPRNGFIENWYSAEQLELVSDPPATSGGGEAGK